LYNWNSSDCDFQYIYITNISRVADLSNITEKQIKGIKLCIKVVSKSFPFVKGFIFDKDNVTYQHAWFLYILIDTEEVGTFYDSPVTSTDYLTGKLPYSTFGISFDWGKQRTPEWDNSFEMWSNRKDSLVNLFKSAYNFLPEEYKYKKNTPSIDGFIDIRNTQSINDNKMPGGLVGEVYML